MKKKSTAISSPKVNPAMDTAQQPSDLAQTDAHDIGSLLYNLREVIKTARAAYGKRLLADLENLTAKFGKGFDDRNLRHIRTFHITFPNWNALRSELSWTQTSYLRKSAESVDKVLEDDPQITQIRADLSTGGQT
ncbi:MAG: hypothetical protein KKD46_02740 [Euryarchaeota archaeon]|nr:hypothetical protein [Euryarchaeota archaeon]MBU4339824.1 hypothetical protein [Euryarchaeota archaeon]MBU4453869.1 hypothetical protein [Euryarchaeota archaeon]MCG2735563.1 DUF1016 N-terminal domain-containing protein [Candidatus Methanoperedenaceae archaeon]